MGWVGVQVTMRKLEMHCGLKSQNNCFSTQSSSKYIFSIAGLVLIWHNHLQTNQLRPHGASVLRTRTDSGTFITIMLPIESKDEIRAMVEAWPDDTPLPIIGGIVLYCIALSISAFLCMQIDLTWLHDFLIPWDNHCWHFRQTIQDYFTSRVVSRRWWISCLYWQFIPCARDLSPAQLCGSLP